MSVNQALARQFEEISQMIDLLGEDSFRASAHARASRTIADLSFDLAPLAEDKKKLVELEGVGSKIADKIIEFVKTGKIKEHEELASRVPPGLLMMLSIPGMGPKTVRAIWQDKGVTDVAGLKRIIADGSILTVPRMGAKAAEKIKAAIAMAEKGQGRLWIGQALPVAEGIVAALGKLPGVKDVAYAGSLRRGRDTVGDIDILASSARPGPVGEAFRALPQVRAVLAAGDIKSSVRVAIDCDTTRWKLEGQEGQVDPGPTIQVDLRVVPPASWGAALMYFTGSKDHNVRLREQAQRQGLTLNEYGLFPEDGEDTPPQTRGVRAVAGKTEEEVYARLGHPYLPPEIREASGELELKETPRLIELDDIKAELHAHTTASDGAMSIEELAAAAKARGYHTIAVTDHSKSAVIAKGLTVERLELHIEAIRRAQEKIKGITILAGSEVDILADGSLDYPDKVLKQLDIVVASPHVALSQQPEAATARLLKAIRHPLVHILGHPTGRLINRRAGLLPDMAKLAAAAREHNVALEINAHWMRLDLRDTHVRAAVQAGCLIAINCDTHTREDMDNIRFGVMTARRGWVEPGMCVNAWGAKRLLGWLKSKR